MINSFKIIEDVAILSNSYIITHYCGGETTLTKEEYDRLILGEPFLCSKCGAKINSDWVYLMTPIKRK